LLVPLTASDAIVKQEMGIAMESLREFPLIPSEWIDAALAPPCPSVNGGVWAARPDSPVLPVWHEWAFYASFPRHTFIADEKVLHILQPRYVPQGKMIVMEGGAWNCSPKFQPANLRDSDIIVRHYHGDSCCRPDKSQKGMDLWWPIYQQVLQQNIGGIRDWRPKIKNRWMDALEKGVG
jgi:hypothetical protein